MSPRIRVLADDLTGAAEIAGVAHRSGCTVAVSLVPAAPPGDAEVVVYDTDSRLLAAEAAAERLRAFASVLINDEASTGRRSSASPAGGANANLAPPGRLVFKKTDSVLRGNVRVEVEALATAIGCTRVLLVPANPGAGRTIRNGIYCIDGVPLDQTEFARDPHHPALTARVDQLLGDGGWPVVVGVPGTPLGHEVAIVVGDATSADDIRIWAQRVDDHTLPAGGREFFVAWLTRVAPRPPAEPQAPSLAGPVLVVSGSAAAAARGAIAKARAAGIPVLPVPREPAGNSRWIDQTRAALAASDVAHACIEGPKDPDPAAPSRFSAAFSQLVVELRARDAFRHLVIEGGATAAAILRACNVRALRVAGEWSPGVVALTSGGLNVTMKPGSYLWPDDLVKALHACRRPA